MTAIAATGATAQDQPTLKPGNQVRVWTQACVEANRAAYGPCPTGTEPRPYKLTGALALATVDSVVIGAGAEASAVLQPLSTIARMDLQRGRASAVGPGAAVGFAVGAAIGVVAVLSDPASKQPATPCDPNSLFGELCWLALNEDTKWGIAALSVIVVGGAGMLLGGLIGSSVKMDRWERVLITVQPDGQLAVTARTRF